MKKNKNIYFKITSIMLTVIMIIPFFPVLKIDADFENTHINTGNQREDIVAVAKTQIGYMEGANNETKYNHWLGSLDGFPANGYGYAWCQSFVSWCAYQANIPNSIILRNSGTVTVKDFFIKNGTYHKGPYEGGSYTPKRGDIIYFYSSAADSKHHVGIVSDCIDGMVYTIEGNTGEYTDRVCEGSYPITYGKIRGYGVPNYDNSNPPTWAELSKNQIWYDLKDTIELTPSSDSATSYWIAITKNDEMLINTEIFGKYSISAVDLGGIGDYHSWISAVNSGGYIDSKGIDFSIVGSATYSNVYTSKSAYKIDDVVSISVDTICAKGQVIGIDKVGYGRVITENCDSTYTINASKLGVGDYSAYFSVFNGSGGVDTNRVSFTVFEELIAPVVTLDSVTENSATIKWKPISGATGYKIAFRSSSDDKYEVIESNYTSTSYTKKDLTPGTKYYFRVYAFNEGSQSTHSETVAAKTLNAVTIHYNVNGGTIASDSKYYAEKNGDVYIVSSKKILDSVWADGAKFKSGLYNASTFKLTKDGYKFLGWSTKKSGGTIFDQDDSNVSSNDLFPEIKEKCGTITLYAQWEVIYTPGDINEDGKTTIADLLLMKKYMLSENTDSLYLQNMDLNNNKEIDIFDIIILKHLLISN